MRASEIHAVCMPFNTVIYKTHKKSFFLAEIEKNVMIPDCGGEWNKGLGFLD